MLYFGRRTGEILDAAFRADLKAIEKDVNTLVRKDIQAFYDSLVQQLQNAGELSNH